MYKLRDTSQARMFDYWSFLSPKQRALMDKSWERVFREHLLNKLPVGRFAKHFSDHMGRPTKDLHIACGVLILQQLHDLTDNATVKALALNISWHYALDIQNSDDAYLCAKTLRSYRKMMIDKGLDRLLFTDFTDELLKAFHVDTRKQRLDSTPIRSAMRTLTRLGTVVETISKFLRELKRSYPQLHEKYIDSELVRKYVDRSGEGCFGDTTPSESKRRLPEAGEDLVKLSVMFEGTEANELASFKILQRVLGEQFHVIASEQDDALPTIEIKEPKEVPCDNVNNPADPDSSYNTHRGQGYSAQIMETYQEDDKEDDDHNGSNGSHSDKYDKNQSSDSKEPKKPNLITHVAVNDMTTHDSHCLEPAIEDANNREIAPQQVLADTHYGSGDHKQKLKKQDIELFSPTAPPKGYKQGRVGLEKFELDDDGFVTKCPEGHEPTYVKLGKDNFEARFDAATCESCPLFKKCAVNITGKVKKVAKLFYTPDRVEQRRRRLSNKSDEFKDIYRWRAGIEATMSKLKHQMNLAKLRVRGYKAVNSRILLRALGLNIHRCATAMST